MELPLSSWYNTVMTVVDSVSKQAHFIPMHTTVTAEGAARLSASSLEAPRPSEVHNLRLRTSVHSLFHPRTLPSARNKVGILHSLASSDRQTDRQNMSTKSWTSTSGYLWTNGKTIGITSYPWQNSSTTIMSILLPNSLHSCSTLDGFLTWASNPDRTLLV